MRLFGGAGLRLILPLVAILVFVILLTFSLLRMVEVETDMRVDAEQNMLWVMHQSESAARRLVEATMQAELGEVDAGQIALRLDLLRSRFALLQDGPQHRFVEQIGLQQQLSQMHTTLQQLDPLPKDFTPAQARQLRLELATFPAFFAQAANKTMIREWDNLGNRLETSRNQLRQIIASLIGIMVTGAILTFTLVLALRLSRQRNRMLRRERDFSGLLISSSGEGILAVDDAGDCTLWNPAMASMMGQSPEQAVGRKLREVAGFFDIVPVRNAVAEALRGTTATLLFQPLFRKAHKPPLYVDIKVSPMRDDGRVIGAIVFMHDASDRYAAKEKEAENRARLEHLVVERTRELDDALTRERSAANLYRNFAGMISHQFRTPLAVADSALQRLIRRGPRANPDEITERAIGARNAIAGLTRMVESTLDAARLQAGQVGARRVPCNLVEVLDMVGTRQRAASPDINIELHHADTVDAVALCDPAHAEQVLENLLSNAVKYAHPNTSVSARVHDDDRNVLCDIISAGPAIDKADRDHVFEPNFRGLNSVGTQGTGVGLFIARSLARMQGGEVSLLPDDGTTTFRLTLPRFRGATK
ncbi:PAS domain-containing sensor histidine kinase [uncultured Aliiroseovarius sp.]|uniref:sensor histidine kinase n=1 Tax=uncultured Aliiroseovarius sp. TaxID=1658783 RepID=UPI0025969C18|nr:PAS domain-containing sensor histidine kinase [uncultured Aliiroseovarius sp.]